MVQPEISATVEEKQSTHQQTSNAVALPACNYSQSRTQVHPIFHPHQQMAIVT